MARVSSITRVLQIIEAVAKADRPLTPLDLSEHLAIPKPTMHRLIQQLQEENFLRVDLNGTIVPANRTHRMAIHLWQSEQAVTQRKAILKKLADDIGETCGIAVPYHLNMVCTDRMPSKHPLKIYFPTGAEIPIWCTSAGKLYLSTLDKNSRKKILNTLPITAYTQHTITDIPSLLQQIEQCQQQQMAIDNEEFLKSAISLSVPISDDEGRYIGSLYTIAPSFRVNKNAIFAFESIMRQAAHDICDAIFS